MTILPLKTEMYSTQSITPFSGKKREKMFYFKYPQLGCYACYPIKYKHYLLENSFDKGIVDYKEHVKAKEEL